MGGGQSSTLLDPHDHDYLISPLSNKRRDAEETIRCLSKWDLSAGDAGDNTDCTGDDSSSTATSSRPPADDSDEDNDTDLDDGTSSVDDIVSASSFPGALSPISDKIAWVERLAEARHEERHTLGSIWDREHLATPSAMAGAVFYAACPDKVAILLQVSKRELRELKMDSASQERASTRVDGVHRVRLNGYEGEGTWSAYTEWLLEKSENGGDDDAIVFGIADDEDKDSDLATDIRELTEGLGLARCYCPSFRIARQDELDVAIGDYDEWTMQPRIGENAYVRVPDQYKNDVEATVCVEVVLELKNPPVAPTEWEMELDRAALGSSGDEGYSDAVFARKQYELILRRPTTRGVITSASSLCDNDAVPPRTPENYHVLWLTKFYHESDEFRIGHHFEGREESVDIQARLGREGTPFIGNCKASILHQECQYLKDRAWGNKPKDWKGKFSCALVLTRVLIRDAERWGWFQDTECTQRVADAIKDLGTYWRLTLLKRTDDELGINPPTSLLCRADDSNDSDSPDEDGVSPSRKALLQVLDDLAARYEKLSTTNCDTRLNWKPVKRKPKPPVVDSSDNSSCKKAKKSTAMLKESTDKYVPLAGYESFTQDAATNLSALILRTTRGEGPAKKKCWQIRCTASCDPDPDRGGSNNERLRVLLVTGVTPLFALTKYVAEAFQWRLEGKRYDTTMTKGSFPPGSFWTVESMMNEEESSSPESRDVVESRAAGIIGTQKAVYSAAGRGAPFFDDKKVKVCHVLRRRGDRLTYRCDGGRRIGLILDGIEGHNEYGYMHEYKRTPKVVGASPSYSLPSDNWNRLNSTLLGGKPNEMVIVSPKLTEEEAQDAIHNRDKHPLFDNEGNLFKDDNILSLAEKHRIVAQPFVP